MLRPYNVDQQHTVDVIGHDNEGIQFGVGEMVWKSIPAVLCKVAVWV